LNPDSSERPHIEASSFLLFKIDWLASQEKEVSTSQKFTASFLTLPILPSYLYNAERAAALS
jgi:hypothetical protein